MRRIEQQAVTALMQVRVGKHPWARERILQLQAHLVKSPDLRLAPEEAGDLWFLAWKFRAQIADPAVVAEAEAVIRGANSLFRREEQPNGPR